MTFLSLLRSGEKLLNLAAGRRTVYQLNNMTPAMEWVSTNRPKAKSFLIHPSHWIHSHVRGSECGFSSIDNHTQHSFSKLHKGVLGLVIEIKKNGQRGLYDFFELTKIGKKTIELCSRQKNCTSTEQHDSCNGLGFYQSAKNKVIFDPSFSLQVRNFMSIDGPTAAHQSEWDNGDFEEDVDDPSEVEENEFRAPPSHSIKLQSKKEEACKICHKSFSNLFMHLSRWSENCRIQYGKEFDVIKKRKDDEQKARKRKREFERYENDIEDCKKKKQEHYSQNKEDCKKQRRERYSQHRDMEKEWQKNYRSDNPQIIKEIKLGYNTRNADKNKVITFSVLFNMNFY